jgi:hypothetical protein
MHDRYYALIVIALAFLIGWIASPGNAQDIGSERDICLQDCRQWIGQDAGFGGRSRGIGDVQARLYARCVERCERKFWKEFDEEFKEQ